MSWNHKLLAALVVAAGGVRLGAASVMAHGSGEHASGVTGLHILGEGPALAGVALLTGVGYWLMNRQSTRPPFADPRTPIRDGEDVGSVEATSRADEAPPRNLVAVRRMRPPRQTSPRIPP